MQAEDSAQHLAFVYSCFCGQNKRPVIFQEQDLSSRSSSLARRWSQRNNKRKGKRLKLLQIQMMMSAKVNYQSEAMEILPIIHRSQLLPGDYYSDAQAI